MLFSRDSIASYLEFSRPLQFHILSSRVLGTKFSRASHTGLCLISAQLFEFQFSDSAFLWSHILDSAILRSHIPDSAILVSHIPDSAILGSYIHSGLYNLGASHSGLCDPLVVFEGLVIVELVRMTLVILLPFQDGQQALNTEIYEVVVVVDLLTIVYGSHF